MEKERNTRVMAIIALCLAVVGLSIGFAAFTRNLNITFSESNVNISGDLDVRFLASADPEDTSTIINAETSSGTTASPATILGDGKTIGGVWFTFNNNAQSVKYDFYIYNNSEYDAYLKSVEFLNYAGADQNKVCTALEGTNQDMVDEACDSIVAIIGADFNGDNELFENEIIYDSMSNISSIKIPKGGITLATLAILYVGDSTSAILPNGDFKINFGDIKLNFSSLEG